jgi:hypothetical protein
VAGPSSVNGEYIEGAGRPRFFGQVLNGTQGNHACVVDKDIHATEPTDHFGDD